MALFNLILIAPTNASPEVASFNPPVIEVWDKHHRYQISGRQLRQQISVHLPG